MALDLYSKISDEDLYKLDKYVRTYGSQYYCGNREYLRYWAKEKKTLYKLLDNNLTYTFPIEVKKDNSIIDGEIKTLYNKNAYNGEECLASLYYKELKEKLNFHNLDFNDPARDTYYLLSDIFSYRTFTEHAQIPTLKYKQEGNDKTLQLQAGMKPAKAMQKIINYFDMSDKVKELFEKFRIDMSMITNDKYIKSEMTFSIQPLDFITASDNNSNWTSCMNWTSSEGGCYRQGTVEMMNSNVTLVCYLNNKEPYYFYTDNRNEKIEWTNKRWRAFFYVHKDFIMNGKNYPYQSEDLDKIALNKLRELAKKNLGWTYEFGPELYKDMKHITSLNAMNNNHFWASGGRGKKQNIVLDTNAMYNDMYNDKSNIYWIIRNIPKHNKMINVSGKAVCCCCGQNTLLLENDDYYDADDYYNDRFLHTEAVVCDDCFSMLSCDVCSQYSPELYTIKADTYKVRGFYNDYTEKEDFKVCPDCRDLIGICPDCNTLAVLDNGNVYNNQLFLRFTDLTEYSSQMKDEVEIKQTSKYGMFKAVCSRCEKELKIPGNLSLQSEEFKNLDIEELHYNTGWGGRYAFWGSKTVYSGPEDPRIKKYNRKNIEKPEWTVWNYEK